MICKQCGFQNNENDDFCKKCGATFNEITAPSPKKFNTGLIVGLIAGGLLLIAAAVILVLTLGGGSTLTGPWHNEELNQLLRFHEDETVVIRTSGGDFEATYLYDQSKGKGVITLNGDAISFSHNGDSLLLTWNGVENAFTRGDMEIVAALAEATPVVTEAPTAAPTATVSATATESTVTTAPESTVTTAPTASPSPSVSIVVPIEIGPINSNIIGHLIGDSVIGTWREVSKKHYTVTYYDDGTFNFDYDGNLDWHGTYTYNKLSSTGEMSLHYQMPFTFTVDGDTLLWDDLVNSVFERE